MSLCLYYKPIGHKNQYVILHKVQRLALCNMYNGHKRIDKQRPYQYNVGTISVFSFCCYPSSIDEDLDALLAECRSSS